MVKNWPHAASMEKSRSTNLTMANGNRQQSWKAMKARSNQSHGLLMEIYLPPVEEINQYGFGNVGKKETVRK